MTIRSITVAAVGAALLLGIMLPMANAQAPPCFTFDGKIQTMQCPISFRPEPVQYYSNAQSGFVQATDDGDELPNAFFDQQTINTLRENAAQNQSQNATQQQQQQQQRDEQILALLEEQQAQAQPQPQPQPQPTATNATAAAGANQNQTAPATTVTSSDIAAVRNSLNAVRQPLEDNNTQAIVKSIDDADTALFAIIEAEDKGPVRDRLITLSHGIDTTRRSVFNLDNEKALQDLNAAVSQLLVISEMLPTPTPTATATATEKPETEPFLTEPEVTDIFPSSANQSETLPMPEPQQEQQEQEPTNIKVPLNQTQQELITVEELADLNINKTTHEKSTITIVQGNKTTHREITTTEVPL